MIKKYFAILLYFIIISISYSSEESELDDPEVCQFGIPNVLFQKIKDVFSIHDLESFKTSSSVARRDFKKIEELRFLYFQAKQGSRRALSDLEKEAKLSTYACALLIKYYKKDKQKIKEYAATFFESLNNPLAFVMFIDIGDPIVNLSLALYHQINNTKYAEQYAETAAEKGCLEGFNILGNLHKKSDEKKGAIIYLKAAYLGNARAIYKLARLCSSKDESFSTNLYEKATDLGYAKAFFAFNKIDLKRYNRENFLDYFVYLIKNNPALCVDIIEHDRSWAYYAFRFVKEAVNSKSFPLPAYWPRLLQAIYKNSHNERHMRFVSHILAIGYRFGYYNISPSVSDAYYWLNVSATKHKNLADAYHFCTLSAADPSQESHMEAIVIGRQAVKLPMLLEKYGTVPQILLARLLVEEAERNEDSSLIEEAWYWLLDAFNNIETDIPRRKRILWQIPGTNRSAQFSEVEVVYINAAQSALTPIEKSKKFQELGFHILSGSPEGKDGLVKAQPYFFEASQFLSKKAYFLISVINHFLSIQHLMHSPQDVLDITTIENSQRQEKYKLIKARDVYKEVAELLNNERNLSSAEKELLKKKIKELSVANLKDAAFSLAYWFYEGMYGLDQSIEHTIYWLKYAASKGNENALKVLQSKYPLSLPLTAEQKQELYSLRTHTDGKPNFVGIGGGISGLTTAISIAKAAKEGKIKIGQYQLVDQESHLLKKTSMVVSRQHRGGEYPKDFKTARQCLFGAAIWEQMFKTQRKLTDLTFNDFLLAKASLDQAYSDNSLSKETLIQGYTALNELYRKYVEQMVVSGKYDEDSAWHVLFGPSPIFHELKQDELRKFNLDSHFAFGIRTGERGFNPVGVGTILEFLLLQHDIEVTTNYEVTDIEKLPGGGFRIKGKGREPIYGQYLINASWHNNSRLSGLINKDELTTFEKKDPRSVKRVFLRSLLLVDVSRCPLPEGHSFFGLVGEHGGMLSFFNKRVASIFIPKEGLSYHGEYSLGEDGVDSLPRAAIKKLEKINKSKMQIGEEMLNDARAKYPFLENAVVVDLFTQTTVSENLDEIFKRTNIDPKWIEGADGCLEVCSAKFTFAPFQALQALAKFAIERPEQLIANFTEEEKKFLDGLISPNLFKEGTVENVVLPDSFKLILDDNFMTDSQFVSAMRRYAFARGLTFALFEKDDQAAAAVTDPSKQLEIIGQEEGITALDLSPHEFNDKLEASFSSLLEKTALREIKLGPLSKKANDDEDDKVGEAVLSKLKDYASLQNLALTGWNLTFRSRYTPLGMILSQLQELHLKEITLTLNAVDVLFAATTFTEHLKRFSFVRSGPTPKVLEVLMDKLGKCPNLEFLDLNGNDIGGKSPDKAITILEKFVTESQKLKNLLLYNNKIYEKVHLKDSLDLPLEIDADPFLLAITRHPTLEKVSITENGQISDELEDRLAYVLLSKRRLCHQLK